MLPKWRLTVWPLILGWTSHHPFIIPSWISSPVAFPWHFHHFAWKCPCPFLKQFSIFAGFNNTFSWFFLVNDLFLMLQEVLSHSFVTSVDDETWNLHGLLGLIYWRFPEIGLPPNQLFSEDFPPSTIQLWGGISVYGNPKYDLQVVWLVVKQTPLKKIRLRQLGWLFPIYGKIIQLCSSHLQPDFL